MPIKLPFVTRRSEFPPDLWTKCPACDEMLYNKQLEKNRRVCPRCGHHFRLRADARLRLLLDADSFEERDAGLESLDPLEFVDQKRYPDRLEAARIASGMRDAAVWGTGRIEGMRLVICVMDAAFIGGSFGSVVGEKVTRATEAALSERLPLVIVSASGGARMQEGTIALMQLAKACAALERLGDAAIPYISILTDPTTGGCFASWASLGDVNLAEPNALIGFAGARVAAGTIAAEFPPGFQRAEFQMEHGFIDRVVRRDELRSTVATILAYLHPQVPPSAPAMRGDAREAPFWPFARGSRAQRDGERAPELVPPAGSAPVGVMAAAGDGPPGPAAVAVAQAAPTATAIATAPMPAHAVVPAAGSTRPAEAAQVASEAARREAAHQDEVWARVRAARNVKRPHTLEFVRAMATDVVELHGDRLFGDDPAIVAGLARIPGHRFVFVGHQKGAETEENVRRNFGMAHPEGYRKAMRAFALAERFTLPVVTFVDTPGAHPGPESEERGVAEAIARAIMQMSHLRTPIVTIITGEGGSGGALAIAVGDVVLALENAIYSVISPEGCASIVWRDAAVAPRAAVAMRLTAADQLDLGVVDEVLPEPKAGAQDDPTGLATTIAARIASHLDRLSALPLDELIERRYGRYRVIGAFTTVERAAVPVAKRPDLAGRLGGLLEAGRRAFAGQEGAGGRAAPGSLDDDLGDPDAPLREEL